ncbi:MAG: hypothetical protein OEV79_02690 [candidate division WOR-3 bacterium]|nr:hypothetical protein [candidate division WOR-3 bacterium]
MSDLFNRRYPTCSHDWIVRIDYRHNRGYATGLFLQNGDHITETDVLFKTQTYQPGAGRITGTKLLLQTLSAGGSGVLLTCLTFAVTKQPIWSYGIGATIGPALGATIVGNALMEPDGSFLRSFAGSTVGATLGGGISFITLVVWSLMYDPPDNGYYLIGLAAGLPAMGAVGGYYAGYKETNDHSMDFHKANELHCEHRGLSRMSIEIPLLKMEFY